MVEADQAVQKHSHPRFSYSYFAETVDCVTREKVGFVPLDRAVFAPGEVVFAQGDTVHDIGAGPGDSTEYLIANAAEHVKPHVAWIASEVNLADCLTMRARFGNKVEVVNLDAIQAVKLIRSANKIFFINGIHLLSPRERTALIKVAFQSLKPNGQFVISTTFIVEGVDDDIQKSVIDPWTMAVFREAKSRGENIGSIAEKIKEIKAQVWSKDVYGREFEATGFTLDIFGLWEMPCTYESYRTISHFTPWNERILPGVGSRRAAVINFTALKKVMRRQGRNWQYSAPRNTLVIVGRKPVEKDQAA